jgi:hypothetical protein
MLATTSASCARAGRPFPIRGRQPFSASALEVVIASPSYRYYRSFSTGTAHTLSGQISDAEVLAEMGLSFGEVSTP